MDPNLENNKDFIGKLHDFYNLNKLKIGILISVLFIVIISLFFFEKKNERTNILIAEKYVQASLYLSSNKNKNAKLIFEEIILSKNKFYSILALNIIIEKDLVKNEDKVLSYFKILENLDYSEEKKDLISFKKALYLLKNNKKEEGNFLLEVLIKKNSNFKSLAKDALEN